MVQEKPRKSWRPFEGEKCENCGDSVEVLSSILLPIGFVEDGDWARCLNCGCPGHVSVDEDGAAWMIWDEPTDYL